MPTGHHDNPGRYEIRLKGHLDTRWTAWFDGLTLTHDDGTTIIHGPVADQAAAAWLAPESARPGPAAGLGHSGPARPARVPAHEPPQLINPMKEIDMAITAQAPATKTTAKRIPMSSTRKTALCPRACST